MSDFTEKGGLGGLGIKGCASAFPVEGGRWFANEELHQLRYGENWRALMLEQGEDPDYYDRYHGYRRRYWTHCPGERINPAGLNSTDLIEEAIRRALDESGLATDEIDLVITFTTTSPRYTSSLATLVAGRLALKCAAFEMKVGCASALYAMVVAAHFIRSGARNVLIAGGDTLSRVTALDSSHLYAVGDGSGAIIMGRVTEQERGIMALTLGSNGEQSGAMGVPGILPPTAEALERGDYTLVITDQAGDEIKKRWQLIPEELYYLSGLTPSQIDAFLPHQVNNGLINTGATAAQIPAERVLNYVPVVANCGPAGILIALEMALRNGRASVGDTLMLVAVGGGIAWGGLILRL